MLIDVYALVYRAFFALPPLTAPDGRPVNAVYGFERMLNRVLADVKPTHVAACFDAGIPQERFDAYPEYKSNRPEMPDDLDSQFPIVRRALAAYGIPIVEVEGEEADDCIATLATRASRDGLRTVIVSGDLDLLQLVDDNVTVVVTRRGISDMMRYDEAAVRERYGLAPRQLPDYRGLKGDPSDNLPGVPGIGEKTAARLIAQYGTLDDLLAHASDVAPKRIGELLERYAHQARACRAVSTAKRDLDIPLRWEDCLLGAGDANARNALFGELGFKSLMTAMPGQQRSNDPGGTGAPSAPLAVAVAENIPATYRIIDDPGEALDLFAQLRNAGEIALTTSPALRTWRSDAPLAFALADSPGKAAVIPSPSIMEDERVRAAFAALLSDERVDKIVHDSKTLAGWASANGFALAGVTLDAQLAHGLLDGSRVEPDLAQTFEYSGTAAIYRSPALQTGAIDLFDQGPALDAVHASAADALLRAAPVLR
ncbi:MAG: hypothetical protein JO293_08125, partial [Candidatus Eremiobacteraeota bacterium]|nr:hypothetical protein [Candidatus Eremiobacteraeota bacterium]